MIPLLREFGLYWDGYCVFGSIRAMDRAAVFACELLKQGESCLAFWVLLRVLSVVCCCRERVAIEMAP